MDALRFRRYAIAALATQILIVLTGATVRLTESGLGCSDWPTCEEDQLIPALDIHAYIEYINRVVITGIVSVAAIAVVIAAHRRHQEPGTPRRTDLIRLSWGLIAGIIGQIALGAVVVLSHLNPWLVIGHFLLSMVLIWDAVMLVHRAGIDDADFAARSATSYRPQAWAMSTLAAVVVFTGTLVTGSGPHAGSHKGEPITRLPLEIGSIARTHGISVMLLVATTLLTVMWLRRNGASEDEQRRSLIVLGVLVAQAAIGYVQYFTGVPVILVGLHIAGAISVWVSVLWFHFGSRAEPIAAARPRMEKRPVMAQ